MRQVFVVGCGSIGQRHIRNLRSMGVSRILAYDGIPERLDAVQRDYGVTPCASFEEGLDHDPEAVLVCTTPSSHSGAWTNPIRHVKTKMSLAIVAPCSGTGVERSGPGANGSSVQCGVTDKDLTNTCGQ